MTKNVYYLMTCYHLTGDSHVKFFQSKDAMYGAYDALVNPILKFIADNNLEFLEDDVWYHVPTKTMAQSISGGFRLNSGESPILDEQFTPDGANVYYEWGIVEVEITIDQLYYIARFSEYVDESEIQFINGLGLAESKYNEAVTEHLDIARMHEGWTIDRVDKTTWGSSVMHGTLFDERETNGYKQAFFGYNDVTETIRYGLVVDETTRRLIEHNTDIKNFFSPEKKQPEITVHIANNPDIDSLASLLSDPILGVFYNKEQAIETVKKAMTDDWWKIQDSEPDDYVTTHIVA